MKVINNKFSSTIGNFHKKYGLYIVDNASMALAPKTLNSSNVRTEMATPIKLMTKKLVELTTIKISTTSYTKENEIVPNATLIQ